MAQPSHREQLIEGAIQCLQTKGYSRTTARDIAAASHANLASIGYHFGSKEALLNEALIQLLEQRNRHVGKFTLTTEDSSPSDRLAALLVAASKVFKAPRPLFVAFVEAIAEAERSEELREQMAALYRDTRKGLEETIRASVGEADGLRGDPEVMASLLLALLDGLVLQWLLEDSAPSGEELITALTDLATLLPRDASTFEAVPDGDQSQRRRTTRRTTAPRPSRATRG